MGEIGSAIVITVITAGLLLVYLGLAETRMRWKVLAVAAFFLSLYLFTSSPGAFAAGLAVQALLGISLAVYFEAGI